MQPTRSLSESEFHFYQDEGYVIPNLQLADELVRKMKSSFERLQAASSVDTDVILTPHLALPESNKVPAHLTRDWLNYAQQEDILDAVGQVIGDNFMLWSSALFCKPAMEGKETPWHQDGKFWPVRPLATCTVWIALDETTVENGCLRVIPRSHKRREVLKHTQSGLDDGTLTEALETFEYDDDEAVDICLKPGQMSIHDVYTVHGSKSNRSGKSRLGFALRFMPTTSVYDRSEARGSDRFEQEKIMRPLFLLRGRDLSGKNSNVICL